MSRVGTSIIAMTAKAYNIPVMVACETYKVRRICWACMFWATNRAKPRRGLALAPGGTGPPFARRPESKPPLSPGALLD